MGKKSGFLLGPKRVYLLGYFISFSQQAIALRSVAMTSFVRFGQQRFILLTELLDGVFFAEKSEHNKAVFGCCQPGETS